MRHTGATAKIKERKAPIRRVALGADRPDAAKIDVTAPPSRVGSWLPPTQNTALPLGFTARVAPKLRAIIRRRFEFAQG